MPIEIPDLDTWNRWVTGGGHACGCCGMPECDTPEHESRYIDRNLCGLNISTNDPWVGGDRSRPAAGGGVSADEIEAVFRQARVTKEFITGTEKLDRDQDDNDVMVWKFPRTMEDNKAGTPATYGVETYYDGEFFHYSSLGDGSSDWVETTETSLAGAGYFTNLPGEAGVPGTAEELTYESGVLTGTQTLPAVFYYSNSSSFGLNDMFWDGVTYPPSSEVTTLEDGCLHYEAVWGTPGVDGQTVTIHCTPYDAHLALRDLNDAIDDLELDDEDYFTGGDSSEFTVVPVNPDDFPDANPRIKSAYLRRTQIRWKIPYPWERSVGQEHGSYCLVTWYYLLTPQAWSDYEAAHAAWEADPEGHPEPPQPEAKKNLVEGPLTWEWDYPTDPLWVAWVAAYEAWIAGGGLGDPPEAPEGDNPWYSDWYEIRIPEYGDGYEPTLGEVSVANASLKCYHGAIYGAKPTFDDSFEQSDRHPEY